MSDLTERVAAAIYDATVAKARSESVNVTPWEKLSDHWKGIHRISARAAITAMNSPEPDQLDMAAAIRSVGEEKA